VGAIFRSGVEKKGEIVVKVNEEPDGIYYIDSGEAETFDDKGRLLATLGEGDIFGEMAYFSKIRKRNATVVAKTDLVVRKYRVPISESCPSSKNLPKNRPGTTDTDSRPRALRAKYVLP